MARGNMSQTRKLRADILAWLDANGGKANQRQICEGLHADSRQVSQALRHACDDGVLVCEFERTHRANFMRAGQAPAKPVTEKWHGVPAGPTYARGYANWSGRRA